MSYISLNTCSFIVKVLRNPVKVKSQSRFPHPMAHRAVPISVSIALGHASANAVKATAGGGGLVHW